MPMDTFETSHFTNLVLADSSDNQSAFEPQHEIFNIDRNELSDAFLSMISDETSNSFNMLMDEEVSSTLYLPLSQGVRFQ